MPVQNGNKQRNKKQYCNPPLLSILFPKWDYVIDWGGAKVDLLAHRPCSPSCQKGTCDPLQCTIPGPSHREWMSGRWINVRALMWTRFMACFKTHKGLDTLLSCITIPSPRPSVFSIGPCTCFKL